MNDTQKRIAHTMCEPIAFNTTAEDFVPVVFNKKNRIAETMRGPIAFNATSARTSFHPGSLRVLLGFIYFHMAKQKIIGQIVRDLQALNLIISGKQVGDLQFPLPFFCLDFAIASLALKNVSMSIQEHCIQQTTMVFLRKSLSTARKQAFFSC